MRGRHVPIDGLSRGLDPHLDDVEPYRARAGQVDVQSVGPRRRGRNGVVEPLQARRSRTGPPFQPRSGRRCRGRRCRALQVARGNVRRKSRERSSSVRRGELAHPVGVVEGELQAEPLDSHLLDGALERHVAPVGHARGVRVRRTGASSRRPPPTRRRPGASSARRSGTVEAVAVAEATSSSTWRVTPLTGTSSSAAPWRIAIGTWRRFSSIRRVCWSRGRLPLAEM